MNKEPQQLDRDTIVAPATPPGKGGVAIIRVSGPLVQKITKKILKTNPAPRHAHYCHFYDKNHNILDNGLALYFPGPNSFTGEDILELHGHGSPVIVDCIIRRISELGARLARPGEFSERAFLNNKIDLAQAEAIADLIESASELAAKSALKSLQGEFSEKINHLVDKLIYLRTYVEAAIDFPDEEVDFLADGKVQSLLEDIIKQLEQVFSSAKQGSLLKEGMTVVIAGKPNAGKSSLLNALSGKESAIVTDIAGTTRDILREHLQIDGMPLHVVDTAGLRESANKVEQEGMRRAIEEIQQADQLLLLVDGSVEGFQPPKPNELQNFLPGMELENISVDKITVVQNKIDLINEIPSYEESGHRKLIKLSAKCGTGMNLLKEHLKRCMGFSANTEGNFIARRRHLEALNKAQGYLQNGKKQLLQTGSGELLAEDLRLAQNSLSEITGQFTNDDLLGEIFSSFCIGK